jgi:hypothetical protein
VKLLSHNDKQFVFHLGRREKDLLVQLFKLYPVMPGGHQKLSRKAQAEPSNQQLLEEALAENRVERQKQLAAFILEPQRWTEHHQGWHFVLNANEIEPLLQVLNDIRVGSWVLLGSPEKLIEKIDEKTAPFLWAMEIAGSFQIALLHILESPQKPEAL